MEARIVGLRFVATATGAALASAFSLLTACGGADPSLMGAATGDASFADSAENPPIEPPDGGTSGRTDSGVPDAKPSDGTASDTALDDALDARTTDGATAEATTDATTDAGLPESGLPDAGGPVCSGPTSLLCQANCVDPTTDPLHCGGCSHACPAPVTHGSATCSRAADGGGSCGVACGTGYHVCNNDCFPDSDSPSTALDACVLTERFAVFVSPAGSDSSGDGSRAHPYATIGYSMDSAVGATNRVYACGSAGSYNENLVVTPLPPRDGVHLYGGLDCTTTPGTWIYDAAALATVTPPTGLALEVRGLQAGVAFEDFAFQSANAPTMAPSSGAGASSLAIVVNTAANVTFTRGKIVAGNGQPGAAGLLTPYTFPTAAQLQGNMGTSTAGGPQQSVSCPGGLLTVGGRGGDSSNAPAIGEPYLAGALLAIDCSVCTVANGVSAPNGLPGLGAMSVGTAAAARWFPQPGNPGVPGGPGQGGGGGCSWGSFGGGGGAGGCGGAAGDGGGGGGASLPVLAVNATGLMFTGVSLTSGNGGAGGNGSGGQDGQSTGGSPGAPAPGNACPGAGGAGGSGGNGGPGGGAAGGLSVGVLYVGSKPTLDPLTLSTFRQGRPGGKGVGGAPGVNDGIAGWSGLLLPAP